MKNNDEYRTRLSQKRLMEIADYSRDTGIFTIKDDSAVMDRKGENLRIDGSFHAVGRLAILYVEGELPDYNVTTVDGDRGNNKYSNLKRHRGYSGTCEHNRGCQDTKPRQIKKRAKSTPKMGQDAASKPEPTKPEPTNKYSHDEEIVLAAARIILKRKSNAQ